jgi:uncharacterized protein YecE (DUF72 family)
MPVLANSRCPRNDWGMNLWIGTSGFQYPEWKGTFYPEKLPASKMLAFYANHFATTEINYSFRRIPSEKTIRTWSQATPKRFKFAFKAPQQVTHFARLRDCTETMDFFANAISGMEDKLGVVLFQLPPNFKRDTQLLSAFLDDLPKVIHAAFEFRHDSWFDEKLFDTLRAHNAALCIAEDEQLAAPQIATADFGYLRLRREDYAKGDIVRWAEYVRSQAKQWRDAFIYFRHEESGSGPKFAQQMLNALGSVG